MPRQAHNGRTAARRGERPIPKKITDEELVDLKRRFDRGEVTIAEIARQKEVAPATARRWMSAPQAVAVEEYRRFLEVRRWLRANVLDLMSLLIAVCALLSSYAAISSNLKLQRDLATERSITDAYSTFYALDKIALDHREVSHLFTGPAYYAAVKRDVELANPNLDAHGAALLRLEERQAASYVFDYFEETVFQYEHARRTDDRQTTFLKRDLDYLTENALRNPRLLWYWDPQGGNLSSDYDAVTLRTFRNAVCPDADLRRLEDAAGPFVPTRKANGPSPSLGTGSDD